MNVVVPMAGRGSRFASAGVTTPKPLIPVAGKPMLAWAFGSLAGLEIDRLIVVALREHDAAHDLAGLLPTIAPPAREVHLVLLDDVTEGQLVTVLAARASIDDDTDLLIAASDTLVVSDIARHIAERAPECAGLISTADMPGDRWSFARTDEAGRVVEVTEKVRISPHASTGLYYFSDGARFVRMASGMIARGEKTRGEYYIMPLYQQYIDSGALIRLSPAEAMWDMGTPDALADFLRDYPGVNR